MTLQAAEQDRHDLAQERVSVQEHLKRLDPRHLVFLDESGAATNLVRRSRRAPVGCRACGTQPAGPYEQILRIAALSLRGFLAPMTVDGAADTNVVASVEHVLVPLLEGGQIVVIDHLIPHKAPRVHKLIEAAAYFGESDQPVRLKLTSRFGGS